MFSSSRCAKSATKITLNITKLLHMNAYYLEIDIGYSIYNLTTRLSGTNYSKHIHITLTSYRHCFMVFNLKISIIIIQTKNTLIKI